MHACTLTSQKMQHLLSERESVQNEYEQLEQEYRLVVSELNAARDRISKLLNHLERCVRREGGRERRWREGEGDKEGGRVGEREGGMEQKREREGEGGWQGGREREGGGREGEGERMNKRLKFYVGEASHCYLV